MPSGLNIPKTATRRNPADWDLMYCEVTAAQTFVAGDWVYKAAAGTLSIAAASGANVDSSALQLFGIAAANAADCLALSKPCPVWVPKPGAQFLTQVYHATSASAVLAASDIDSESSKQVLPLRNQGGIWCLGLAEDGTDDCVAVVERHEAYAFSETFGWFWGTIIPAAIISSAT